MIFSTSNDVSGNTFTTTAAITSGSAENVKDPDFSKNLVSSSAIFHVDCGTTTLTEYVGVHGLSIPIGTTVVIRNGAALIKTFTTTRLSSNMVFFLSTPISFTSLRVEFDGVGVKIVSYIQAGLKTVIAWGVNSGKSLSYFTNNTKSRVTVNRNGQPISRLTEKISPKLSIIIRNEGKAFIRGGLQDVFTHYNKDGIVSILDYENDDFPDESVAAFDLSADSVNSHSLTSVIANIKLNFRVSV